MSQSRQHRSARFILAAIVFALPAFAHLAEAAETPDPPQAPGRVVHFPKDFSLGHLLTRDANAKRSIESYYHWIDGVEWESRGEARGDVIVPEGRFLFLSVRPEARDRVAALANLHLAGLTRLDRLALQGGPGLTDAGLNCLADRKRLNHRTLTRTITDAGLRRLEGLPALGYLSIRSETACSRPAIARLRKALPHLAHAEIVP